MNFTKFDKADFIYFTRHLVTLEEHDFSDFQVGEEYDEFIKLIKLDNWTVDNIFSSRFMILFHGINGYAFYSFCCMLYQLTELENLKVRFFDSFITLKIIQKDSSFVLFELNDLLYLRELIDSRFRVTLKKELEFYYRGKNQNLTIDEILIWFDEIIEKVKNM